jgi:hypothetical protein
MAKTTSLKRMASWYCMNSYALLLRKLPFDVSSTTRRCKAQWLHRRSQARDCSEMRSHQRGKGTAESGRAPFTPLAESRSQSSLARRLEACDRSDMPTRIEDFRGLSAVASETEAPVIAAPLTQTSCVGPAQVVQERVWSVSTTSDAGEESSVFGEAERGKARASMHVLSFGSLD